jgi:hypothetical protein
MQRPIVLASAFTMLASLMFNMPAALADHCGTGHGHNGKINGRQKNERKRISQGIRSGELTGRETARLKRQKVRLAHREAFMRQSGGVFTPQERAKIQHGLDHLSKNIYQQKHDKQDR